MTIRARCWTLLVGFVLMLMALPGVDPGAILVAQVTCDSVTHGTPSGALCVVPVDSAGEPARMQGGGDEGGILPMWVVISFVYNGDGYLGTGIRISSTFATASYLFTAVSLNGSGTVVAALT